MIAIELRPYQLDAVNRLREALRQHRRVCFQLQTGGGKTIVFAYVARGVCTRGRAALILVHRCELIRQTLDKLASFGVEAGVIANGWPANPERQIQVASVQNLARRLDQAPEADLVVVDEAHHAVAATWSAVLERYPDKRVLGVTATPEGLDGKGLAEWFDDLICGPSVRDLIDGAYLADADVLSHPAPDLSGIRKVAGDYVTGELAERMSDPTLLGNSVAHYRSYADGRPAIALCVSIRHAELVAAPFASAGYRAASVDGSMPTRERDRIINGLASGELQIVTSCALISEGLDIADAGAAILLRPTASLAMFLQQIGRALRPKSDGSRASVLDHAGNCRRHGQLAERRMWSLEGREAREAAEQEEREREEQLARSPDEQADFVEETDGQLVPLTSGEFDRSYLPEMSLRQELRLCVTEADVRMLGRLRGYKPGWAWHILREREARNAA